MEQDMSQLVIPVPLSITEDEAKLYLAMKLLEVGRLSCGEAAKLAGYSKRTFMELLGKHGVAFMDYPPEELKDDLRHA
jgi:predicted HTH domain antitoxin